MLYRRNSSVVSEPAENRELEFLGKSTTSTIPTKQLEKEIEIRKQELKLITAYDSDSINEKNECWCLLDAEWVQSWLTYVSSTDPKTPRPPMMTTGVLKDNNGKLRPNLEASTHYRGVSPVIYSIYKQLYGADHQTLICRKAMDIYDNELPQDQIEKIMKGNEEKARKLTLEYFRSKDSHLKVE